LVGMQECGKTSLLARLHQIFQAGPIKGFDFAGCRSLPRLDELNWLATIQSCVSHPKMVRSSAQFDNSFIHLAVRPMDGGTRTDLLLNDISGETFEAAVKAQGVCETLLSLPRADHLVVVVDGAALGDMRRNDHVSQTNDFLQRIVQGGYCGMQTAVHLVISKLDELKGHALVADELEADIKLSFGGKFGSITCWRVAARPMDHSQPTNPAICDLFLSWVQTSHRYPAQGVLSPARGVWSRDFCRSGS
jgi:hypothetical protein